MARGLYKGGTACSAAQTINTVVLYSLQRCHPASCRRNTLEQVQCKTLLTDWPCMHAPIISDNLSERFRLGRLGKLSSPIEQWEQQHAGNPQGKK